MGESSKVESSKLKTLLEDLEKRICKKFEPIAEMSKKVSDMLEELKKLKAWQPKTDKRISELEQKLEMVSSMEKEIMSLKQGASLDIQTVAEKTKEILANDRPAVSINNSPEHLSKSIRDELHEQRRIIEKQNNIIVYGLNEQSDPSVENEKVLKLLYECDPKTRPSPRAHRRLGKPSERPRPLLVEFNTSHEKKGIMQGKGYLRTRQNYKEVFIAHDLTIRQREERKKSHEKNKQSVRPSAQQ
jgi:hypothetical protein